MKKDLPRAYFRACFIRLVNEISELTDADRKEMFAALAVEDWEAYK